MALEATFRNLSVSLDQLHEAFSTLDLMFGDKPADRELALIDAMENSLLDTIGELYGAKKAALDARKSVGLQPDLNNARVALTTCQQYFHRVEQHFALDLVSYEKLKELVRLGEKGKEWRSWAERIRKDIEQCRQPLEQTRGVLGNCWEELSERLGTTSISVRNVVGQKIIAGRVRTKNEIAERMT